MIDARKADMDMSFRVMSFNIRVATAAHVDGLDSWKYRAELNVRTILKHRPEIISFQELQDEQWNDYERLMPQYHRLKGRPYNNYPAGYAYPAIFWRPECFTCIEQGAFWVSETPEEHSLGWDATSVRSAAWARLKCPAAWPVKTLLVVNTHLDNDGAEARLRGAQLVALRIADVKTQSDGVILTGDFNDDPGSPAHRLLLDDGYSDACTDVKHGEDKDGGYTFHKFLGEHVDEPGKGRIDWIMYLRRNLRATQYTRVLDCEQHRYPSDHFPIIATFESA